MVIVLLGYMGSGKSTVGKELAQEIGVSFTDLDDFIEAQMGQSISQIFHYKGEIFFRKKEHELLTAWFEMHNSGVLALGGGTPCYAGNMKLIGKYTQKVIYLQLTVPSLVARLRDEQDQRPLIAQLSAEAMPEFIGNHLFERSAFYTQANFTLKCDAKSVLEIVAQIRELI
ncbi:MAG: hypothetical protein RLZZ241_2557 [Bacteroidota bacterium]|jgi:shikimate kinase